MSSAMDIVWMAEPATTQRASITSHARAAFALAVSLHALILLGTSIANTGTPAVPGAARVDIQLVSSATRSSAPPATPVSPPPPARTARQSAPAVEATPAMVVPAPAATTAYADSDAPATAGTTAPVDAIPGAPAPVSEARVDTRYDHNPVPFYPATSRRLGESGEVLLRVRVSAEGTVLDVAIAQSSGFPRLDSAARAAVKGWRFLPARQGDEKIESSVQIPLRFVLDS